MKPDRLTACLPFEPDTQGVQWSGSGVAVPIEGASISEPDRFPCIRARANSDEEVSLKAAVADFCVSRGVTLKPAQAEAVEVLFSGQDVAAIQPTGYGKTVPGFVVSGARGAAGWGLTLAVNPLKALAADQERRALAFGLKVAVWNSDKSDKQKAEIIAAVESNAVDLLITTPESLRARELQADLLGRVGLLWIDEAHSAMELRNFRHTWGKVGELARSVNPAVVYACTATCEAGREQEMFQRCGLRNPHIIRLNPDRPNFTYKHVDRNARSVAEILREHDKQKVIVYTATVHASKVIAGELAGCGYSAACYHGQLRKKERADLQAAFGAGKVGCLVATDALGLGIDWPDVRAVVCFDPAESVNAFFQQAGRAGRDGMPSTIYLCSRGGEDGWNSRRFLITASFPALSDIERTWNYLNKNRDGVQDSQPNICRDAGVEKWKFEAGSIFRHLKSRKLAIETHEGRVFTWFARGVFGAVDWQPYLVDKPRSLDSLTALRALWDLPADEIRAALVAHFEGDE